MNLEMGFAIPLDRGAHTDIGDAGPGLAVDIDIDQVHPGQWNTTTLELNVGRGGTQLARQLLAVQDPPGDTERPAEQPFSQGEIGGGQRIANLGAADANTFKLHRLSRLDGKTVNQPGLLQEFEIANAITAKPEVIADLQVLHAKPVHQDGIDKLAGAELAQPLVKGQTQDPVDAFVGQQLQFVPQPGQTGRGRIRGENSLGCGSKITTQLGTPNSSARSRSLARIAWWPR